MTRQRFKTTLAFSVGFAALMTASAAMAREPELSFHPAKPWAVNAAPENGEISTGGTQACSIQSEFNNGFVIKLNGSERWIENLEMDFRQDSFTPGNAYTVDLTVPGKSAETLSAQALSPSTLAIDLKGQKKLYSAMRDAAVLDMQLQENAFRFYLTGFATPAGHFEQCMANGSTIAPDDDKTQEASNDPTLNESIALEENEKQQSQQEEKIAEAPVPAEIANENVTPPEQPPEEVAAGPENTELAPPPPVAESKPQDSLEQPEAKPETPATENSIKIPEAGETAVLDGHAVTAEPVIAEEEPQQQEELKEEFVETIAEAVEPPAAPPAPQPEISVPAEPPPVQEAKTEPVVPPVKPAPAKKEISEETKERLRAMAAAQLAEPREVPAVTSEEPITAGSLAQPENTQETTALLDEPAKPMPELEDQITETTPPAPENSESKSSREPITNLTAGAETKDTPPPVPVEPVAAEETQDTAAIPVHTENHRTPEIKTHTETTKIDADFTSTEKNTEEYVPFSQFEDQGQPPHQEEASNADPAVMNKITELEQTVTKLQSENSSLHDELKQSISESEKELLSVSSNNWSLEQATMRFNESERQIRSLGEQIQKERAQCSMEKNDLETQLFDPQITSQAQLARLAELEQQLAAAQAKLTAMGVKQ